MEKKFDLAESYKSHWKYPLGLPLDTDERFELEREFNKKKDLN